MEQPTPDQIASKDYFKLSLADTERYLQARDWRSGPSQELFNKDLRFRAGQYKIIVDAQTALYEHGQKVELPEETKKFLVDEANFYQRIRDSKLGLHQHYPTAVEAVRQVRLDMGLIEPEAPKPQVHEELPEVPHIPRDLPVITAAGSYHQQER